MSVKVQIEKKYPIFIVQDIWINKQYHMKVLLNSLQLNGHTPGFHPTDYNNENEKYNNWLDAWFWESTEGMNAWMHESSSSNLEKHYFDN